MEKYESEIQQKQKHNSYLIKIEKLEKELGEVRKELGEVSKELKGLKSIVKC